MNIKPISEAAEAVLRKSQFIIANELLGVQVPPGVEGVTPEVVAEIASLVRTLQIPAKEAVDAVLQSMLESHGLAPSQPAPAPPAIVTL